MNLIDTGIGAVGECDRCRPRRRGRCQSLLVDGVIGGVGSVLVFLPQILILFFFLAVLEDCGYMARAAYLMDKLMVRVGLSGKSFIPLLSSFACAIPGVMATRVIENRRDRLTTILVAPLMSCSARLPVYTRADRSVHPGPPVRRRPVAAARIDFIRDVPGRHGDGGGRGAHAQKDAFARANTAVRNGACPVTNGRRCEPCSFACSIAAGRSSAVPER